MENKTEKKKSPKKRSMVKIDDTVAIAEKYRKLAKKDIVQEIVLNNNILSWCILQIKADAVSMSYIYYYKFTLNGKEYFDKVDLDPIPYPTKDDLLKALLKLLSEKIAYNIFMENRSFLLS